MKLWEWVERMLGWDCPAVTVDEAVEVLSTALFQDGVMFKAYRDEIAEAVFDVAQAYGTSDSPEDCRAIANAGATDFLNYFIRRM